MLNMRKNMTLMGGIVRSFTYAVIPFIVLSILSGIQNVSSSRSSEFINVELPLYVSIVLFLVFLAHTTISWFAKKKKIHRRNKLLSLYARYAGMESSLMALVDDVAVSRSLLALGSRDRRVSNYYYSEGDYEFYDYEYAIYKQNKYGEHKDSTVHFAVASFALPRKLPNVFFDGGRSGGKEFRVTFDQGQRHSLEGDFDKYFTTYFGSNYEIDSLSFITPEVMQALIEGADYDIEIYDDKLYLYCELKNMPHQIKDVMSRGQMIRKKLLNNIVTYRDERLPFAEGRKSVATTGARLKLSHSKYYTALAVSVLSITVFNILSIFFNASDFRVLGLSAGVIIVTSALMAHIKAHQPK